MDIRLNVERMTPEGQGLARPESVEGTRGGKVHFVPYSAPGDVVEAAAVSEGKGYTQTALKRVLKPGPGRVEPRCELHFRENKSSVHCGGCSWQHLSAQTQGQAKREIVRDCLFRIAKLREPVVEEIAASPESWRYRNKVLVPVGTAPDGRPIVGFYSPGSHKIAAFEDCLVQPELSVGIALKIRDLASELKLKIYDEARHEGWLRHIFVRTNTSGQALAGIVVKDDSFPQAAAFVEALRAAYPQIAGIHQNIQTEKTAVVLGRRWVRLWGEDRIEERLGPLRLNVSPSAFLQINTPAAEILYGIVSEFLFEGNFRPSLLLDLYSGVGSIALWLATGCERVLGLEEVPGAVSDARANAILNGAANAEFQAGRVEDSLTNLGERLGSLAPASAAVVLDPPRAGCDRSVLKALQSPALKRVVYVSCNPATFARDADRLKRWHWRLVRVRPVDLFPQTSHVEVVGLFERPARA